MVDKSGAGNQQAVVDGKGSFRPHRQAGMLLQIVNVVYGRAVFNRFDGIVGLASST